MSNTDETPVLSARGLSKHYGRGEGLVRAVDSVDLEVAAGETVAVMGPSGCGKSTLLHLLGGLDRPTAGEVALAGRRIDEMGEKALARLRRSGIGFVFQAFHLMDELTAVENVELPALLGGRSPRAARRRALELLDSTATLDVLRLFDDLHKAGQTLVIVTHDARIAATADRMLSMRDGAFVDETRLTGGTSGRLGSLGSLGSLVELEG